MSWIVDKMVRSWESWKYPEDKEKKQRIEQIVKEANEKPNLPDPKKPYFIKD